MDEAEQKWQAANPHAPIIERNDAEGYIIVAVDRWQQVGLYPVPGMSIQQAEIILRARGEDVRGTGEDADGRPWVIVARPWDKAEGDSRG